MSHALGDVGIEYLHQYIFNCFVVRDGGDGAPLAVDVGIPSHVDPVLRAAGSGAGELIAMATHAHSDHVAGLPLLHELASAKIHLPEKVRDYLAGESPRHPRLREIIKILPVMLEPSFDRRAVREALSTMRLAGFADSRRFVFEPPVAGFLADMTTLEGAPDWQVLRTPGHTDCSTSFYNAKTRTLMSGDAVLTYQGQAWFNPEITDATLSAQTEDRLRGLDVEHLLPGHGAPISGPNIMGEALSFRERPRRWFLRTCRGWFGSAR